MKKPELLTGSPGEYLIWKGAKEMCTIDSLNDEFIIKKRTIGVLEEYVSKISEVQSNSRLSGLDKAYKSIEQLKALIKEVDCKDYAWIGDAITIGEQYVSCIRAITGYKNALFEINKTGIDVLKKRVKKVKDEQNSFDQINDLFNSKYEFRVNSISDLNSVLGQSAKSVILIENQSIEEIKEKAKDLINREYTIDLRSTDPLQTEEILPDSLLIARYPSDKSNREILREIGIGSSYQNITLDLHNQGNVIVNADYRDMSDEKLDEFIIAYILRFIETFPLGSVRVHIFDQNTNYLYKRLNNCFQLEEASELVKKIVTIHSSLNDLTEFRDVICEDIFRKTSVNKPDLYSIYEDDKSDPFNLIIIRDGLVDGSGYASAESLDIINSLSKPSDIGHRCGLRFLIVDNSRSFSKSLMDSNKYLVNSIQDNCGMKLNYAEGQFVSAGKKVDVLRIQGNLDAYIQERSQVIIGEICKKEKSYISLDDVSSDKVEENLGNILYIPVGLSGGKPVELPLSCKDEDGTVAGQCIGYMAIGQTGSGKSSFFHSVVLNGCMKYSPKDLQFWLLDFKNGGASSKYSRSGIPHIRIIAENNKIDDALCLFQMILEEMERRNKAFNRNFTDNIIEYNKKAEAENLERFPRIIIAIDEVQEIFREDNAAVIQKLISSISTRMRSAGMHFVMVAQNLSEGKSYMLKDAFLPSATGRICFRVSQDIPRDSGFGEEFIDRRNEISELKTGEAYVSYGKGTIKKVKMVFVSPQEMSDKYFASIQSRYPDCSGMRPLVIGSKRRLSVTASIQGSNIKYYDVIKGISSDDGAYNAVIGEDVYRMSPLNIQFSQHENTSVLFLGSDKRIASSLCASTAVSLIQQDVKVHLFNGDRTRMKEESKSLLHPFMFVCQMCSSTSGLVENHRLDQFKDVIKELYSEYLERQELVQKSEYEDVEFDPVFLVVNDLFGIESFNKNEIVERKQKDSLPEEKQGFNFDYDIFSDNESSSNNGVEGFRENVQTIMGGLLNNGYRYNMYVVLALRGDPSIWRNLRITSEINNVVLFNKTEFVDQIDNSYYLKEMLKNISNDTSDETMAVWLNKKSFSKIRPIIYKMADQAERDALERLIGRELS